MARLRLVVPCYNEARRLDVEALAAFVIDGHDAGFLFVDDGSRDATAEVLEDLCARAPERLSWLRLDQNRGKAEAVRHGMRHALRDPLAEFVGYWDADLATPLDQVELFLRVFAERPAVDLVMGSRVQMLGHDIERKAYRHAYGRLFMTAVANMLDLPVYDTQCGAKIFRATDDVRQVFEAPFLSRWIFDVEILARLMARWEPRDIDTTTKLVEVALPEWHDVAGSKVTVGDAALAGRDLARMAWAYRDALAARRRHRGSR